MKYSKYPSYKDSGVEWLGEIPEEWDVSNLKYLYENLDNRRIPISASERETVVDGYPYYGASGIIDYVNEYIYSEETILVGEDGANLLSRSTPLAFIANGKYWVNNHAHILRFKDKNHFYWSNVINNLDISPFVSGSAQPKLTSEALGNLIVTYPKKEEERKAIATYLDRATQKIDTLIAKQSSLIALLKEKRQALISHAVTKGLNPDAKMKESGVEWLGEIPEGWTVSPLKYLTRLIIDGAHFTPTYVDKGVPFLRVTDLHNKIIDKERTKYIPLSEHKELIKRCKPERGDLLLSKNGTIGLTKIIDWDWEFSVFVSLCLIKFKKEKLKAEYFSFIFQSNVIEEQLTNSTKKTSVMNLHLDKINELNFVVPSLKEQTEIIEYLDQKTQKIDILITKAIQAIELLKEKRTALISAVVTGKVDVRSISNEN